MLWALARWLTSWPPRIWGAAWEALSLDVQRRVVRALMDVRLLPAGKGVRFSPEHVQIDWKGSRDDV